MQCSECGSVLPSKVQVCPTCGANISQEIFNPSARLPVVSETSAPSGGLSLSKNGLPQAGDTFAGRYRIEKYLGLGSLCNAYLCRDLERDNREVVLKIMHSRKLAEAGMAESFLFLAESVGQYNHKGIAKIFASGRHENACYYVMEWISGTPLRLWLMERLNFENRVLPGLAIIRSLLEIFEVIHERGCYGCLKPENVFITLNGPVVMDFGVVGFLTPQEFEFNSYARRYIPYMAPELRQDWSNLLPHSDYYSLGSLLYEVLVGRAPGVQLRLPSELSRIFGIEADEIILKSLASKPLDRFGTLEAFKNAVESLQSTLLNRNPLEPPQGVNSLSASTGKSHLDITNDFQAVHNPDLSFSAPTLPSIPKNDSIPSPAEQPPILAKPRVREIASKPGEETKEPGPSISPNRPRPSIGGDGDAGAGTLFYPSPVQAESEQTLSNFANLADKILEDAHSQRRFAHVPITPLPASTQDDEEADDSQDGKVASEAIQSSRRMERSIGDDTRYDTSDEEEESEPVPAWMWILIGLAGTTLLMLSAYLGIRMQR
jgi:serine/threonine protein kinase